MLKYHEFIEKVNEAGFWNRFTNYINPEIFIYGTESGQAYTGDSETDTTKWNTRAAQEKKLACGYFFNGNPGGFIAPRFYSIFIDAFKPRMTIEERDEAGKLGEYERKIWTLLNKTSGSINCSEFYMHYGFKAKNESRNLEPALKRLQMTFDLTVSEVHNGIIGYDKVENWVPAEWLKMNPRMEHEEALEVIYRQAEKISRAGEAQKAFRQSLKLYKSFLNIS